MSQGSVSLARRNRSLGLAKAGVKGLELGWLVFKTLLANKPFDDAGECPQIKSERLTKALC